MDGVERRRRPLWKNLKERLGFNGMGFCGSSWVLRDSDITVREEDEEEQAHQAYEDVEPIVGRVPAAAEHIRTLPCVGQIPTEETAGMNLATALAVERNLRGVGPTTGMMPVITPLKSLMRLFEETDGLAGMKSNEGGGSGVDGLCCVCMERDKGAAFIPCGHTYCRVCSRELWLNRGSCPLCNRSITEILDIF